MKSRANLVVNNPEYWNETTRFIDNLATFGPVIRM
jgi:hypothetical protein